MAGIGNEAARSAAARGGGGEGQETRMGDAHCEQAIHYSTRPLSTPMAAWHRTLKIYRLSKSYLKIDAPLIKRSGAAHQFIMRAGQARREHALAV
ncbi:hypothetical protein BaRGS_00002712 [Batillaria attramentaria]|uniref:Uncharacterized protein n=1 Tax=Batillaria attramentaria TaxID=370345 RepID=A0ABD0M2L3_9CAEN